MPRKKITTRTRTITDSIAFPYLHTLALSLKPRTPPVCVRITHKNHTTITHSLQYASLTLARLHTQGYITRHKNNTLTITPLGLLVVHSVQESSIKKWDKRWRIVSFDIPESRKKVREYIRRKLSEYGYLRIQDSIWMYPYACPSFLDLLQTHALPSELITFIVIHTPECSIYKKRFNIK